MKIAKRKSVTTELLLALIPYTRQNLMLTFHPNAFFNELERIGNYSHKSIKQAYYRAKRNRLIRVEAGQVVLSEAAKQRIAPYIAKKLIGNVQLMVIFDIPEEKAYIRRNLRTLLVELKFRQIQRSVWVTDMDYRQILKDFISEYHAKDWIKIYEAAPLDTLPPSLTKT